ncbi:ATP binding GTP binding nucleotide binding nucleoside-triphosphatase [Euphorbia peplus]|nr:ATP binding GTP binding nucleotide binding nucleoside-triphosphatase [Euphorbia peplus]
MKNNNHVISLYGRIGVGKTTLLMYLNNQFLRHRCYDFVIYVVFSLQLSTPSAWQGEIAKQIGLLGTPGWNEKEFEQKSEAIFDLLSGKRYAILIDDFWGTNVNVLDKMRLPCPNCKNRCKVVVSADYNQDHTTLSDTHIRVIPLAWDDACSFFKHEAKVLDPKISSLATQVALLCQGLPKALVKIAHLMKYNKTLEEWQSAIQILEKCDHFVPGREYGDLAQILCDELGKNSTFSSI